MEIVDIDTQKLLSLGKDLVALSKDINLYLDYLKERINKMSDVGIWRGKATKKYVDLSNSDIPQYKKFSETLNKLGLYLISQAEALEADIVSLRY